MKKFFLFLVSLLIGIGLFTWIIKFVGWQEIKNAFLVFTGWQGIVILILTLLIILIGTLKWKMILKSEGEDISFLDLFKIYLAGFSIMFFLPMVILGGEIFRGYILKKRNSLHWSKGIASSIIDRILDWTTILVIIFLGTIFFLLTIGLPPKRVGIILGGTFLFFLAATSFFYFKIFKRESIVKFFLKFFKSKYLDKEPLVIEKEIFAFFNPKKIAMWKGFFLAFLGGGIFFLRTWFLVSFLGKNIGFLLSLSVLSFSCLARMVPIPASLGIQETTQVFVFNSLGLGAATGTVFTLIIRGAELILALLGAFIFFRLGFRLLEDGLFQKQKTNKNLESGEK
ncbi:flippase-like domain-containing protein [Patescibacteria group bacterium]|nr:flippase-like domain-containing protein [Patescibacteria group bacterium]MBZ9578737.1 flippase-like domain-containing protein [Patescibacteria group bacterium]